MKARASLRYTGGMDFPLVISPDGKLGYLPIHKCASTTYNFHFQRRLGWGRSWREGLIMPMTDTVFDPDPEEILVIIRDPEERMNSAIRQEGAYDPSNPHFWSVDQFLTDWERFRDRMTFVYIEDVPVWCWRHGLLATDDRLNPSDSGSDTI